MTVLKSCLKAACRTHTVPSYRTYYGSYHTVDGEKERDEYIKMFQQAIEAWRNYVSGSYMEELMQTAMQDSQWSSLKFLKNLISDYVQQESADGREDVWSSWSVRGLFPARFVINPL
jgi:hypothetical protein